MHQIFFEMKQSHLTALRLTRGFAARVGLTPARVDLLRAVLEWGSNTKQSRLRHSLCVSKTVISVMVRALERLGFVKRTRSLEDRRTFDVALTGKAKHALRTVYGFLINEGVLALAFVGAFVMLNHPNPHAWELVMDRLRDRIVLFRRAFGIGYYNPWDVNEDDEGFYYADDPENPIAMDGLAPLEEEEETWFNPRVSVTGFLRWGKPDYSMT